MSTVHLLVVSCGHVDADVPPKSARRLEERLAEEQQVKQQCQQHSQQQPQQRQSQQPQSQQPQPQQQRQRRQQSEGPPGLGMVKCNSNVIGVKHYSPAQIQETVWWLSQSQCRSMERRIPANHISTKRPSIQGVWSVTTF